VACPSRGGCEIRIGRVNGGADADADADAALVRSLHDEHAGALYSFCVGFTGDAQRAEDVVQEVLVRAWRHAGALRRDARPVRPWLFTTARNLLTDAHRAEQSRPGLLPAGTTVGEVAARDDIVAAVESWTVAEALARLSAEHREVLVQAHWMGRSVAEIAEVLGVPVGTVKSRTYYAVRALRLTLDEMGLS
jgi:RNA polymerase sigma-70 factor (ECF subfamily)